MVASMRSFPSRGSASSGAKGYGCQSHARIVKIVRFELHVLAPKSLLSTEPESKFKQWIRKYRNKENYLLQAFFGALVITQYMICIYKIHIVIDRGSDLSVVNKHFFMTVATLVWCKKDPSLALMLGPKMFRDVQRVGEWLWDCDSMKIEKHFTQIKNMG